MDTSLHMRAQKNNRILKVHGLPSNLFPFGKLRSSTQTLDKEILFNVTGKIVGFLLNTDLSPTFVKSTTHQQIEKFPVL